MVDGFVGHVLLESLSARRGRRMVSRLADTALTRAASVAACILTMASARAARTPEFFSVLSRQRLMEKREQLSIGANQIDLTNNPAPSTTRRPPPAR